MAEIEDRVARRSIELTLRRRRRRAWVGMIFALLVAGGVGGMIGWRSHRDRDDILAAENTRQTRDFDISKEVNRTLLNLWKMEDVEAVRNRGRTR